MPAASKTIKTATQKVATKGGKSKRADLVFPVARIGSKLRHGSYFRRVSDATPVFLAAVLEFLVGEVLDLAGSVTKNDGRQRIVPTNIFTGVQQDANLVDLFSNIIISEGGCLENIHEDLLFIKKKSRGSRSQSQMSQGDDASKSKDKAGKSKDKAGKSKDKKKDKAGKSKSGKSKDGKSKSKDKKKGDKMKGDKNADSKSKNRGKSQAV